MKQNSSDHVFKRLMRAHQSDADIHWEEERRILDRVVHGDIDSGEKRFVYRKIRKYFKDKKDLKILDFGCGAGQLVVFLQLLGYGPVYGIDVFPQSKNNDFIVKLGGQPSFFEYDKKSLPFQSDCFDLVVSEQVLEHVFDLDCYYRETARVLKKGGVAYLSFPHRMIPFDSHSKTWFIHYFPRRMRKTLYRITGRDFLYFESILNFKTIGYHKRIASRYFSLVSEETYERILSFNDDDLNRYEGNRFIRSSITKFINIKAVQPLAVPFLCKISNIDLCLVK